MVELAAKQNLVCHPATACSAVAGCDAAVAWLRGGMTRFDFEVTGRIAEVLVPPVVVPSATDQLWEHTCFELFAMTEGAGYVEFNFSPSSCWAAYRFDGYRRGMRSIVVKPPEISVVADNRRLAVSVVLDLAAMLPKPWQIGLSAVIEETHLAKSYWALAHPAGEPDFHHGDCFALTLGGH
jgi:hypothetical protein